MGKSNLILKSQNIFDSVQTRPFPGFVAVSGNRIRAVGSPGEEESFIGPDTKVYDMGDKLIMPGFHDSHVHLVLAGMYRKCANLMPGKSENECVQILADHEKKNPSKGEWIIGFGWYHVFWKEIITPKKGSLDKIFPDRPVLLINAEAHAGWANSKALEIAGIDKNTKDPEYGTFDRDEHGEPTGMLYEGAIAPVAVHAFDLSEDQEKEFIHTFMDTARTLGITSINDVMPYFGCEIGNVETYSNMDKADELSIRIHAAPNLLSDLDVISRQRDLYRSEKLTVDLLKQFLDGVCTTYTALMLDDYTDAPGVKGTMLSDLDAIEKAVLEAHERGFSIKLHSCGDASARYALDYYQRAIDKFGPNGCRHAIEHVEIIKDEDIPRFGELSVIPSMQPEHLALTQTFAENPYPKVLGPERSKNLWPNKRLLDSAGVIAIGSDCPVVDNDPMLEVFRAVTRVHNDGEPKGGWLPKEKLSMDEVLRGYTYGSAYGVQRENELGSLKENYFADIVVLDKDLFTTEDIWQIKDTKAVMTVFDGKIVFEA